MTRQEAIDAGLATYHGGKCSGCGGTERYARSGRCVQYRRHRTPEQRQTEREWERKRRERNRDAIRKKQREWFRAKLRDNPEFAEQRRARRKELWWSMAGQQRRFVALRRRRHDAKRQATLRHQRFREEFGE